MGGGVGKEALSEGASWGRPVAGSNAQALGGDGGVGSSLGGLGNRKKRGKQMRQGLEKA